MDYKHFNLVDFILDDFFQEWVLNPTPDADKFWQSWLLQNPEKESTVKKARAIMLDLDFEAIPPGRFNKNEILQNIRAAIKTEELTEELEITRENEEYKMNDASEEAVIYSLPARRFRFSHWHKVTATAAAVLLMLLGVWQVFLNVPASHEATGFGETKSLVLPDGSEVVLNAKSSIRYRDWQGNDNREIELVGEAFFSVVHTEDNRKFTVHSNGVAIEVLGTEFNVNNRRGMTQVVLKSGKVLLNLPQEESDVAGSPLHMKPGDLVEVSEKDQKITRRVVDPEKYASWTKDVLTFDNVPLSQVFEMIQDNYGYNVNVVDEGIGNKIFDAEISSKDIDLIIRILSRSFNLEIEKQGQELIVKKAK